MIQELMEVPFVLKKLDDIKNNKELVIFFDLNWHAEKIQEIVMLERNLENLIKELRSIVQDMHHSPHRHIDQMLDVLARIYVELGKCAAYANEIDDLIKKVIIRKY